MVRAGPDQLPGARGRGAGLRLAERPGGDGRVLGVLHGDGARVVQRAVPGGDLAGR